MDEKCETYCSICICKPFITNGTKPGESLSCRSLSIRLASVACLSGAIIAKLSSREDKISSGAY